MTNDKKDVQRIYPTTFLQNDYVTKIYSCVVWSKNQNDGEYLKLYIPKYLLKDNKDGKAEE